MMLLIYKFNNIEIIIYRWLIYRIIKILQQYKLKDTGDIWFLLKKSKYYNKTKISTTKENILKKMVKSYIILINSNVLKK